MRAQAGELAAQRRLTQPSWDMTASSIAAGTTHAASGAEPLAFGEPVVGCGAGSNLGLEGGNAPVEFGNMIVNVAGEGFFP